METGQRRRIASRTLGARCPRRRAAAKCHSHVATAEEGFDGGRGGGVERAEGLAVVFLEVGEEGVPSSGKDLPEGRGAEQVGG